MEGETMEAAIDKSRGYILMWRSIMESTVWTNPKLFKVYAWCLFRANHRPNDVFIGHEKVRIMEGQFITSIRHASEELGMAIGTVHSYFDILKSERLIERLATKKYTRISVKSWMESQNPERTAEHKMNAKRTQNEPDNTLNTQNTKNIKQARKSSFKKPEDIPSYIWRKAFRKALSLKEERKVRQVNQKLVEKIAREDFTPNDELLDLLQKYLKRGNTDRDARLKSVYSKKLDQWSAEEVDDAKRYLKALSGETDT